ncbi:MAG: TIGR00266 family protein [Planctomycetota bacterium]|nr:MAG: TIGR00266 family protein [Planctomycetota bacterium]
MSISNRSSRRLSQGSRLPISACPGPHTGSVPDPRETVVAEAGAMMFMCPDIHMDTKMGDGSNPDAGFMDKIFSAGKRVFTGESLFMTHFTADGSERSTIAFGAPYPGKIVSVDLASVNGTFLCQKQAFLCAAMGTELSVAFSKRFGAGLFGGEGFILQKLRGDGLAFVHAGGTVIKKELAPGQRLMVDTGCIVGFDDGIDYDISRVRGIGSMLFGGEGLFLAQLTGPGSVFLQSLPFSRLADRIIASAPRHGGSSRGEGSVLGGFGRLLGGDNR